MWHLSLALLAQICQLLASCHLFRVLSLAVNNVMLCVRGYTQFPLPAPMHGHWMIMLLTCHWLIQPIAPLVAYVLLLLFLESCPHFSSTIKRTWSAFLAASIESHTRLSRLSGILTSVAFCGVLLKCTISNKSLGVSSLYVSNHQHMVSKLGHIPSQQM